MKKGEGQVRPPDGLDLKPNKRKKEKKKTKNKKKAKLPSNLQLTN